MANTDPAELAEQRFDLPHPVSPATAKTPVGQMASAEPSPSALSLPNATPLEGQARELAEWLQRKQCELESRTAMVAEQEQDLEEKVSAAREWLESRQQALDDRESRLEPAEAPVSVEPSREALASIASREQELDARHAQLDTEAGIVASERAKLTDHQRALDARLQKLEAREKTISEAEEVVHTARRQATDLELREQELRQFGEKVRIESSELEERERRLALRQQEIESAIDRYERLDVAERRIAELQEQLAEQSQRERYFIETETLLAEERATIAEKRETQERQHGQEQQKLTGERAAFEQERSAWQAERKAALEHTERREAEFDRREAALERVHGELQTMQREVLEMRLATEETWAQLTGLLAPATLMKSVAKVRAELADHYAHALQQITDGRGALRETSTLVSKEFERLETERLAIEEWAHRRHGSLGEAAARLEGREQELDRQQRQFEQFEARWAAEREAYREQIRTLLAELRVTEPPIRLAAAA